MYFNNFIVLLVLISNVKIFTQSNFKFSTDINITLANGLAINKIAGNLDFGEIIYNGSAMTLSRSANEGVEFEVTGGRLRSVTVTFPNMINLNNYNWVNMNGGKNGSISFTPIVERSGGFLGFLFPKTVTSGSSHILDFGNAFGNLFLWVGGTLNINQNQPIGTYNGTFTITIAY